jgi:hypothetical protein
MRGVGVAVNSGVDVRAEVGVCDGVEAGRVRVGIGRLGEAQAVMNARSGIRMAVRIVA